MSITLDQINELEAKLNTIRAEIARLDLFRLNVKRGEDYNAILRQLNKLDVEYVDCRNIYFDMLDDMYREQDKALGGTEQSDE